MIQYYGDDPVKAVKAGKKGFWQNVIDSAKATEKTAVRAVTYPVEEVLKSVVRPVTQLTSSVLTDTGSTLKKATGSIWGIAAAGAIGLAGYLIVTGKIKLPKGK